MPEQPLVRATLSEGDLRIPIEATFRAKYSLMVRALNGHPLREDLVYSKLEMELGGDQVEIGPCRFIADPGPENGFGGYLVCVDDVLDFENLILNNSSIKLQSTFATLPAVLSHKDMIKPAFKEYTANLTYDLSVYKKLFDDLDHEYRDEPATVRAQLQRTILDGEGRNFMSYLDDRLGELTELVSKFSKEENRRHGFYFRRQLWHIIQCSRIMKRGNLKPRGYSGDSEMMRMLYEDRFDGDSTFSKLMHKHPTEQPGSQAVRNRRRIIAEMIHRFSERRGIVPEGIKVLSVASGAAPELRSVFRAGSDAERFRVTLLDQDQIALHEAAEDIQGVEDLLGAKIRINFLNHSVRTMLLAPQLKDGLGRFDLIYSMGLFDYLTPRVAEALLGKLLQLLRPGGEMIVGNFHISNPSRYYMEYWLDWVLFYRTEGEFMSLLDTSPSKDRARIFFEDAGCQMFLQIEN